MVKSTHVDYSWSRGLCESWSLLLLPWFWVSVLWILLFPGRLTRKEFGLFFFCLSFLALPDPILQGELNTTDHQGGLAFETEGQKWVNILERNIDAESTVGPDYSRKHLDNTGTSRMLVHFSEKCPHRNSLKESTSWEGYFMTFWLSSVTGSHIHFLKSYSITMRYKVIKLLMIDLPSHNVGAPTNPFICQCSLALLSPRMTQWQACSHFFFYLKAVFYNFWAFLYLHSILNLIHLKLYS